MGLCLRSQQLNFCWLQVSRVWSHRINTFASLFLSSVKTSLYRFNRDLNSSNKYPYTICFIVKMCRLLLLKIYPFLNCFTTSRYWKHAAIHVRVHCSHNALSCHLEASLPLIDECRVNWRQISQRKELIRKTCTDVQE